jgi:hypothetical protein
MTNRSIVIAVLLFILIVMFSTFIFFHHQWSSSSSPYWTKFKSKNQSKSGRTAVCASGQLRTLNMRPSHEFYPDSWAPMWSQPGDESTRRERSNAPSVDLEGMTVAESIKARLYPSLGDFDVFMTVGTRESSVEPKAGDVSECEVLRSNDPSSFLSCDIYRELDLPVLSDTLHWANYFFRGLEQPILQQMYGIFRCFENVKRHEYLSQHKYDYILRLRLEYVINSTKRHATFLPSQFFLP